MNLKGIIKKKWYHIKRSPLHESVNGSFIFIHITKTGGISIARALEIDDKQHYRRHYTAKEAINRIGLKEWNRAYKFSVVRNPFEKVYSQYNYRVWKNLNKMAEKKIPFNDWILCTYGKEKNEFYYDKPRQFLPQVEWLKNTNDVILLDYIIRFENLHSGFQNVAKNLGLNVELPHLNKSSSNNNYKSAFNQTSVDIISHWFRDDLSYFNYKF